MLRKMNTVTTVTKMPYADSRNHTDIINAVDEIMSKYDYKITVNGIGDVVIDRKRIKESLKYESAYEELMAYQAIPEVLRNGIIIGNHDNHKLRNYGTITIAAPVDFVLNDDTHVRGNVGVVIKKTTDNFYKVHRVLTDEGNPLKIKKEADTANLWVEQSSNESKAIRSASSTDSVTLERKNGNKLELNPKDWQTTRTAGNKSEAKSLQEIVARIEHDYGINITTGHIRGDAMGNFNARDKGIKVKVNNDLPTIAHEFGHWLDKKLDLVNANLDADVVADLEKALGDEGNVL